ncbi:MAG: hypothetical protein GY941_00805 [Planctomycetes bacterium]|nr:hypothetical protein [Planctomycetota bacterium]
MRSENVSVSVDLTSIQENAQRIAATTSVPVLAVVKADAYGLGAEEIVSCLLDLVDSFCVFNLTEAIVIRKLIPETKEIICLGPPQEDHISDYLHYGVRPIIFTKQQARLMYSLSPVISIDTGMQRFACPKDDARCILQERLVDEALTHATNVNQVDVFKDILYGFSVKCHAANSSLLAYPETFLDAVRPGLALYQNAVRVSTHLAECHKSKSPVGYSGFTSIFHGIIPVGYSHGLRNGPCSIEGKLHKILEIGMQTTYIELSESNYSGQEVILFGDDVNLSAISREWGTGQHEALVILSGMGKLLYT